MITQMLVWNFTNRLRCDDHRAQNVRKGEGTAEKLLHAFNPPWNHHTKIITILLEIILGFTEGNLITVLLPVLVNTFQLASH